VADPIQRLVQHLSRLPGIGEKTATRLAFHLIRSPEEHARGLAAALVEVVEKIRLCSVCMNVTEDDPCGICRDTGRDAGIVCAVSSPSDVVAIDRSGHFQGVYHVLHGLLSPLEGIGPEDLRIDELLRRIERSENSGGSGEAGDSGSAVGAVAPIREVIVATSANVEGEATAMYLARLIKPMGVAVSRIASGIPVGGELEYTDQATIARAMDARAPL
jgi:recombination protein RecR